MSLTTVDRLTGAPRQAWGRRTGNPAGREGGGGRIPAIDGLRAVAILMVFVYHMWEFAGAPAVHLRAFGRDVNLLGFIANFPAGVDLFMVLSGFCLFLPVCQSDASLASWNWRRYAVKRVRRIVPPYYAAIVYAVVLPMVLVLAFRAIGMKANWQPVPSARQWITHLLFMHTWFADTWQEINGSFWSLGLEMQFYIVFPLVVLLFRRVRLGAIAIMIGLSVAYRLIAGAMLADRSWTVQFLFSITFLGRWMQFAMGMAAAWLIARGRRNGATTRWTAGNGTALLFAALLVYVAGTISTIGVVRDLLLAVGFSAAILALCLSRTPFRRLVEHPAIVWLGGISYSVFLIHQPTAWYLSGLLQKKLHLGPYAQLAVLCTVGLVVICAVSQVFYLAFEAPFMNRPSQARLAATHRILAAAPPPPPVAAATAAG